MKEMHQKKWTHKMYLAYYGMGRKELANLVHLELYGVENNKSKVCVVWKETKKVFKVLLRK
jgi:hypothetical protein